MCIRDRRSWTPDGGELSSHPNSRFCTPIKNCTILAEEYDNPDGVPISAILFGGRRADTVPTRAGRVPGRSRSPSAHRQTDGRLSEAAVRGAASFLGADPARKPADANCALCHVPETAFLDHGFHDVGRRLNNGMRRDATPETSTRANSIGVAVRMLRLALRHTRDVVASAG